MRKPKNVGKIITIGTIMLALFVAIMFVLLFNNWLNGGKTQIGEITGKSEQELLKEIQHINFYENGWDRKIVAEIVDNEVPIPTGFEFVSGTKETGLIVRDKNTNLELMWIPYDENASVEGMEEYYKNVEYKEIESEAIDSIEKYGGFYVTLEDQNEYETLKQLNNEAYQTALAEAEKVYENSSSVYGNLLSLTELQQVLAFANRSGIKITQTNSTDKNNVYTDKLIDVKTSLVKTATENKKAGLVSVKIIGYSDPDEQDAKYDKDNLSQIVLLKVEGKETQVPIPKGFKYNSIDSKIVKITDKKYEGNNLSYIWVPVNSTESVENLEKAKEELNKLYEQKNTQNNWQNASDPTGTEYDEMLTSVETYGGFYMAEAELGFDDDGNPYNKARGMKESLVNLGEYYRTVKKEQIKEGITEKGGLDKNEDGGYILTYEKAKEIASGLSKESTVSHITYGAEWDAAMLWITKTNKGSQSGYRDIVDDVIASSAYMPGAKYSVDMKGENFIANNMTLETTKVKKINGMYGLAGNLCDLTQETIEENGVTYRILRGGGFASLGNETPMASRIRVENLEGNDIGFRTCLYIKSKNINIEETEKTENSGEISKWNGEIKLSFAGGNGTENNPYLIESGEELAYLAQIVNGGDACEGKYFKITKDIDLNNKKWTPIGGIGVHPFKGILDGAGHSIQGLNIEHRWTAGLVAWLTGNGVIKNISIQSGNVHADSYDGSISSAGALCGSAQDSAKIENCHNDIKVTANGCAAGIVGIVYDEVTIKDCTNTEHIVSSKSDAGGIVGFICDYAVVDNCLNKGTVESVLSEYSMAGGICGSAGLSDANEQNKIINCTNEGKVISNKYCGGILGYARQAVIIEKCRNEGELVCYKMSAGEIYGGKVNTVTIK